MEFITADDWANELKILFMDLLDSNGQVSSSASNPDTEAGIAYARVRAVYPSMTREMLAKSTVAILANEPAVRELLGSVQELNETKASALSKGLQRFVDSKEKTHGKKMEFWPLVKVVRIYTKASALSTGAVIVDLVSHTTEGFIIGSE